VAAACKLATLKATTVTTIMYVKPGCPYCQAAREHLAAEGENVEERDATQDAGWKAELMGYTNSRGVVPTIVRDGGDVQVGFPPGRG
jgi:glutaredoxin 3